LPTSAHNVPYVREPSDNDDSNVEDAANASYYVCADGVDDVTASTYECADVVLQRSLMSPLVAAVPVAANVVSSCMMASTVDYVLGSSLSQLAAAVPVAAPSPRGVDGVRHLPRDVVSACFGKGVCMTMDASVQCFFGDAGCNYGTDRDCQTDSKVTDIGCQTKRTLKLGVATQCNLAVDEAQLNLKALRHAESHITTLDKHIVTLESEILAAERLSAASRRASKGHEAQSVANDSRKWLSPEGVFQLFRQKRGELGEIDEPTSAMMDEQLLDSLKQMTPNELRQSQSEITRMLHK
jgi:hypothetical protein